MTNRKDTHVILAQKLHKDKPLSDFDNINFVYNSFAEMSVDDVDLSTKFAGLHLEFPFFINAMTGGSKETKEVNRKLATFAKAVGIPMASGSLSAALKDKDVSDSFKVIREVNKDGLVFANIGAEYTLSQALEAIKILKADAIQIHLNVIQELVMPEGDRNFVNWLKNIEEIVKGVSVPVIVKEVGFGMSRKTIKQLVDIGVDNIDISGSGGTNFASIENYRRKENEYQYLEGFGQSTIISLLEAQEYINEKDIIASGGITNPLDIIKCLALGAKAVGISAYFLNLVLDEGVDKAIMLINDWKYQLKVIMTILGKKNITDLTSTDMIIGGNVKQWCKARNIDYKKFANRDTI